MKIGNKLRGLRAEKGFTTIYMAENLVFLNQHIEDMRMIKVCLILK